MAQEKGAEQPLYKFTRFKANINEWYTEMHQHGLSQKEQDILKPLLQALMEFVSHKRSLWNYDQNGGFGLEG